MKPVVNVTESQQRRMRPRVWANVLTNAIWVQYAFRCASNAEYSYLRPQSSIAENDFFLLFKMTCKSVKCKNKVIGIGQEISADASSMDYLV